MGYGVVVEHIWQVGGALGKDRETHKRKAKHAAAKRWVFAVNNWGKLGQLLSTYAATYNYGLKKNSAFFFHLGIHQMIQEYLWYAEAREEDGDEMTKGGVLRFFFSIRCEWNFAV